MRAPLRRTCKPPGLPADYLENPQTIQRGTVVVTAGALSAGMEYSRRLFRADHPRPAAQPPSRRKPKRAKNSQEIYSIADL